MDLDDLRGIEPSISSDTKVRRTFLKRATAGAVIASIPGRSAWAGIDGSIVASGHGSDFNKGNCTRLKSRVYFENGSNGGLSFKTVFGGAPFDRNGNVRDDDLTFLQICEAIITDISNFSQPEKRLVKDKRGDNQVNLWLFVMYLNARDNAVDANIDYDVLSQHNNSASQFADYLYREAIVAPGTVGAILKKTVNDYKNGRACI